jgi:hypothetical protein
MPIRPASAHASGLEEEKLALFVVFEEMKSAEFLRLTPLGNVCFGLRKAETGSIRFPFANQSRS